MTLTEAVVEPLVVGVVKSLLLERPFQVPVDFGHKAEAWDPLPHALGRLGPEGLGPTPPCPFKDVRQNQHGHVTANAVTLPGDLHELPIIASCVAGWRS